MLTSRAADTLRHIAKEPRRLAGLTYNHYYAAQNLYMQGFVARQMCSIEGTMQECYVATDVGRKELNEYDVSRSSSTVPDPPTAA